MTYFRYRFSTAEIMQVNMNICSDTKETKYLSKVYSDINKLFNDLYEEKLNHEANKLAEIIVKNSNK